MFDKCSSSGCSVTLPITDFDLFAVGVLTSFGVARTRADRLSRLVDLMQRVSSGQKSAATLAQPLQAGRNAADRVHSSAPAAKTKLISDKQPLFDAVPSP